MVGECREKRSGDLSFVGTRTYFCWVMPRQVRCPWTKEEDSIISELVIIHTKQWSKIANDLEKQSTNTLRIRTGKQCRERWHNHLNPDVNKAAWTPEEDAILEEAHQRLG